MTAAVEVVFQHSPVGQLHGRAVAESIVGPAQRAVFALLADDAAQGVILKAQLLFRLAAPDVFRKRCMQCDTAD